MKFKDLHRFTRCHDNGEQVQLHRIKKYIDYHIADYDLQLCPDFQRGNVWTTKQQIAYIEFILQGGQTGRTFYFNDSIKLNYKNTYREYVCVDGLQRLTSILKFVNDEIPAFDYYYSEFEDKADVWFIWIVNDLQTKKEVLQWYVEMNTGGTIHSIEEIERIKKMIEKEI